MQAIVLAAGKGRRLRSCFPQLPKALIPVGGKPLVTHTLDKIIKAGLNEIYLVINPGEESLFKKFLKGYPLKYLYQESALGPANALSCGESYLKKDFLLSYCDLITNFDYSRLIQAHRKFRPQATLVLKREQSRENEVEVRSGRVVRIVEKPVLSFSHYTAIGVLSLSPEIFNCLEPSSESEDSNLPQAIQRMISEGKEVRFILTKAYRVNLNTKFELLRIAQEAKGK